MEKCPICKDLDATKPNVHMIPWFLIKKVVTKEGVGLRELALAFSITPGQMNKVYTGGNILPEKLEELKDFEREEESRSAVTI